jgi:hypothetical protein
MLRFSELSDHPNSIHLGRFFNTDWWGRVAELPADSFGADAPDVDPVTDPITPPASAAPQSTPPESAPPVAPPAGNPPPVDAPVLDLFADSDVVPIQEAGGASLPASAFLQADFSGLTLDASGAHSTLADFLRAYSVPTTPPAMPDPWSPPTEQTWSAPSFSDPGLWSNGLVGSWTAHSDVGLGGDLGGHTLNAFEAFHFGVDTMF